MMIKKEWLELFRENAREKAVIISNKCTESDKFAELINKFIKILCNESINKIKANLENNSNNTKILLEEILLVTYVSYVVMLEFRNKFRKKKIKICGPLETVDYFSITTICIKQCLFYYMKRKNIS